MLGRDREIRHKYQALSDYSFENNDYPIKDETELSTLEQFLLNKLVNKEIDMKEDIFDELDDIIAPLEDLVKNVKAKGIKTKVKDILDSVHSLQNKYSS